MVGMFISKEKSMPLIATITPEHATGRTAEIYGQMQQALGRVSNAFQLYSASPAMLDMQWQYLGYYFQHPTLSFPLLAAIRMLVSQDNNCEYCIGMNEAMLIERAGFTVEQIAAAKRDPAATPLDAKDKAMLLLVLKATQTPLAVTAADLDGLRKLGWTDRDIFDGVSHGARNVAVDIVFNTFKIENDF
jgi:AhpD family alkylhydroperoxidase